MELTIARNQVPAVRTYAESALAVAKSVAAEEIAESGALSAAACEFHADAVLVIDYADKLAAYFAGEPAAVAVNIGSDSFGVHAWTMMKRAVAIG